MTDKRVKDLTYGRLGKPVYDPEDGWIFPNNVELEQTFHRLLPLKTHAQSCLLEDSKPRNRRTRIAEITSLTKRYPELNAAVNFAEDFSRTVPAANSTTHGSLLSYGQGLDFKRFTSRKGSFPIIAIPSGEAGHLLKVIRPKVERRSWGGQASPSVPFLLPEASDEGLYEIGCRSTIHQIVFSNEEQGSGTWLAVRQSTTITILRIAYNLDADHTISDAISIMTPTKLIPTSVVCMSSTDNEYPYVDVCFNPFYQRQVAVIDRAGNWKILENEPRHGRERLPTIVPAKSGNIFDSWDAEANSQIPQYNFDDGWNQIFWVCDLSTIVVCNRTHLAVFDTKSSPVRLDSSELMISKGLDLILDVKRSAESVSDVFVLTTSRIYWIKIVPLSVGDHGSEGQSGLHVVLSYRHFRSENDLDMRLTVLQDQFVSVFIHSKSTSLVNSFCFLVNEDIIHRQSAQSSFQLFEHGSDDNAEWSKSLRTMTWIPSPLELPYSTDYVEESDHELVKAGVRFFQTFVLKDDLTLASTFFALKSKIQTSVGVEAPNVKVSKRHYIKGSARVIDSQFIVHDVEEIAEEDSLCRSKKQSDPFSHDTMIDLSHVYQTVTSSYPVDLEDTASLLGSLKHRLEHALIDDHLAMGTLADLFSFTTLSETLEQFGQALDDFLSSLPASEEASSDLVVHNMARLSGIHLHLNERPLSENLLNIYSILVDNWISCLPPETPIAVRGSKFKMVRQVATELCLSMITLSLRNKAFKPPIPAANEDVEEEGVHATRESSPATFYSAQASLSSKHNTELNFPTPTYTPSVYSNGTSASGLMEDPAITRLRQYAVSIKSRPDTGKSRILSEWPTIPGVDPATYTYKGLLADSDMEDSEQESRAAKKEAARRRRRTENFVQRSTAQSSRAVSPVGSQATEVPTVPFSSQPMQELPMTQPDRGTFGSRKRKGKKKQRTAGF